MAASRIWRQPTLRTVQAILALALLYAATGKLALLLALPPGFASAFFPPAGIALAAVCVRGKPMLLGVALGSLLLNLLQSWQSLASWSPSSLCAVALVCAGSTTQAWIGSLLFRRMIRPALDTGHDVLSFLLLAPLACLISSSIAIAGFHLFDIMPPEVLLTNWLTWWIGDSIGVLLGAPLAWTLIGEPRSLWQRRRWLLSLPLTVSSAAFISIYLMVGRWENEQQMQLIQLGQTFNLQLPHHSWQSWITLAGGLMLTGLLGAFLLLLSGQRMQIERVMIERTRKLHEREASLSAILDNAADAILTISRDGSLVSANGAASRLFGYPVQNMHGLPLGQLIPLDSANDSLTLLERLGQRHRPEQELAGRHAEGHAFPLSLTVSLVDAAAEGFFICTIRDLSEEHRAREKIYQLAHQDPLTGLANRLTLNLRLEELLLAAQDKGGELALMFIDLDHFKKINDSQGHHAGDQLLIEAGMRLKTLLPPDAVIARLGSDEFIIALAGVGEETLTTTAGAIIATLREPFQIDNQRLLSGASIGISRFPSDGDNVDTLLRNADAAVLAAKLQGRGRFQFFTAELNAAAQERLLMENRIWLALERHQFELYLQPQINLGTRQMVGAEVLLRWRHPELGFIPPEYFIPIAEESGLILPLGEWVLESALRILAGWQERQLPPLRLALNLSARQCHSGTVLTCLDRIVTETRVDLRWLEIEITETAAMQDPEQTRELLRQLRIRGIKVAIDDFGTGYSSLNYLKLFEIDRIKIDRSFVKDIENDQNDAVIASATIALGHTLGLEVIAEGVETEGQCAFLIHELCDEAQGYLFGKPMPVAQFETLLSNSNTTQYA